MKISELEKEIKEINEDLYIERYTGKVHKLAKDPWTLCYFIPGRPESLELAHSFDCNHELYVEALNVILENLKGLYADDDEEAKIKNKFKEFKKKISKKGFYIEISDKYDWLLAFTKDGDPRYIGEFYEDGRFYRATGMDKTSKEKWREGIKLLTEYIIEINEVEDES